MVDSFSLLSNFPTTPCLLGTSSSPSLSSLCNYSSVPLLYARRCPPPASRSTARSRTLIPMASFGGLLAGMFKGADTGEATRTLYADTVALINGLEPHMSSLSDSQLREKTALLQQRARRGDSLDSFLPVSLCLFCSSFLFSSLSSDSEPMAMRSE